MPEQPSWYRILMGARKASGDGKHEFTARDLVRDAGIKDAGEANAGQIASAWLSKFVRWGYATKERNAVRGPDGGRPLNTYLITEKGMNCRQTESRVSMLTRLVAAVRHFEKMRGTVSERPALKELGRICDEVEGAMAEERKEA